MSKLLLSRWREEQGLPPPCPEVKSEEWAAPRAGDTPLVALARQLSSHASEPDRRVPARAPRAAAAAAHLARDRPRRAVARSLGFGAPEFRGLWAGCMSESRWR